MLWELNMDNKGTELNNNKCRKKKKGKDYKRKKKNVEQKFYFNNYAS